MTLIAPSDSTVLRNALFSCQKSLNGPVAIRYPRGVLHEVENPTAFKALAWGKSEILKKGHRFALISVGTTKAICEKAISEMNQSQDWTHCDLIFIKPLDIELLNQLMSQHEQIVVVEEGVRMGGAATAIQEWAQQTAWHKPITALGVGDQFVEHGAVETLQKKQGLDVTSLKKQLQEITVKKQAH